MNHRIPLCLVEWVEEFYRLVQDCPLIYSCVCHLLEVGSVVVAVMVRRCWRWYRGVCCEV